jgi:hypothetical protein
MAERPIHVTSTGSDTDGLREFPDGADSGLLIPTHTTAQRNSSPSTGEIAFNSTLGALEFYSGSAWVPLNVEAIQDTVGAMFSSNTETNINVTYDDTDGTIDLVSTNTQLTQEQVEDFVNGVIVGGTNVTSTYDDGAGTLTLSSTDTNTQLTQEQVEDFVNGVITAGANISKTYDDGAGTLTIAATDTNTQLSTEQVQDIVGAMFTSNTETRIAVTYDDTDGNIDLVVTDMTANDNTQLSQEQVEDFVGGMLDGTETFITVGYDDTNGNIDFVVPVQDEDDMSSNSATHLATQQSIKAYVDTKTSGLADVGLIVALG